MNLENQVKAALNAYLTSSDTAPLRKLLDTHPELIARECGEYPDTHRLMDVAIDGRFFRACRRISPEEAFIMMPIDEVLDTLGVPLWLEGEGLKAWARDESENPSDEPTNWGDYR